MLYKDYSIEIWKSEWVGKTIDGTKYSLDGYWFPDKNKVLKSNKYIALVCQANTLQPLGIHAGSTPLIAFDLAKFAIDLHKANWQKFDMMERYRIYDKNVQISV